MLVRQNEVHSRSKTYIGFQSASNSAICRANRTHPAPAASGGAPIRRVISQINQTFARLLIIGVPFLLVLACGTVWLVVGRALRPVEQIRGAVTAITSADLSLRVPEPGTDDEIGRLARTMNDMLARLEDAAARQRRFVADASHELRSPLTAIRTAAVTA